MRTAALWYTDGMATKTTLREIGEMLTYVVKHMATKEDLAEIRRDMATKEQIVALHTQVNAIETDIRTMKQAKLEARIADLEDEVFGSARR